MSGSKMECKVLCDNIGLKVRVTVMRTYENVTVNSDKINFHGSLTFSVRQISYSTNATVAFSRSQSSLRNVVLICIQKMDENDKSTYKIKLSCPEFKICDSTFYIDEDWWRVVNENNIDDQYSFTITLDVETINQVKFSTLYDDVQLTDFKLKGKDGEIHIHKAILAAASASFKLKLINGKNSVDMLEIPDTSVKTLQDFKKSIYIQELPDENLEQLSLLASHFKINWLEYKCVDKMMKNISYTDAINLLEFALKHRHMLLFLGIMDQVQSGTVKINEIRKHYLQQ